MLEFAIVLPLLIILVFGITELGRALYQQNTLVKSIITGARYVARTPDAVEVSDDDCVKGEQWNDAINNAWNLIVYGNLAGSGEPILPNLDGIDPDADEVFLPQEGGIAGVCVIRVHVDVPFEGVFGIIPFTAIEEFNINATTEERYIGE